MRRYEDFVIGLDAERRRKPLSKPFLWSDPPVDVKKSPMVSPLGLTLRAIPRRITC